MPPIRQCVRCHDQVFDEEMLLCEACDAEKRDVDSMAQREIINAAIHVPDVLITDDGRILHVQKWKPIVDCGSVLRIELTARVQIESVNFLIAKGSFTADVDSRKLFAALRELADS